MGSRNISNDVLKDEEIFIEKINTVIDVSSIDMVAATTRFNLWPLDCLNVSYWLKSHVHENPSSVIGQKFRADILEMQQILFG